MSVLNFQEQSVNSLIDEVKNHKGYRPEINSTTEAVRALRGLPPYTYLIRKGEKFLEYYVSYVETDYQIISQRFIIDESKLIYQYWNSGGWQDKSPRPTFQKKCKDPYYLNYYEDLNDVIFIASMKSPDMHKVQTLV